MRKTKPAIATVLALAMLLAAITWGAPLIARDQARKWIAQNTGRSLTIEKVSFNPLTLVVELQGLSLSEKENPAPFITFDRLRLNLSASSLFERALIASELALEGLSVQLVRTAPNRFNFSDFLELAEEKEGPPAEPKAPLRFFLGNITVTGAAIEFEDLGVSPATRHTVRNLDLAIPFIGNVPYIIDNYVTPLLSATVNEAPFRLDGELKPFADTVEVTTRIRLDQLDLPTYIAYLPKALPVTIESGNLTVDLHLAYRASGDLKPELILDGSLALSAVELSDQGNPLLHLPHLALRLNPSRLLEEEVHLADLKIQDPKITLARSELGEWNLLSLGGNRSEKDEGKAPLPRVTIGSFSLQGGEAHLVDRLPSGAFRTELLAISLRMDNFSTEEAHRTPFTFTARSGREEQVASQGDFSVVPTSVRAEVKVQAIPLAVYYPYLASVLTRPVGGTLDAAVKVVLTEEGALQVAEGVVDVTGLSLPFGHKEGIDLKRLTIDGISADTGTRQAVVGAVDVEGGTIRFSRRADGTWSPLSLVHSAARTESGAEAGGEAQKPFDWRVARIALSKVQTSFTDAVVPEVSKIALRDLRVVVDDLHSPGPTFAKAQLSAGMGRHGSISMAGKGQAAPLAFAGELRMKRFPLPPFAPYLPDHLHFELVDGDLDGSLALRLKERNGNIAGQVQGDIGIRRFEIVDGDNGDDLLRWDSLQLDKLIATLHPFSLRIAGVALNDFLAKVIILPDGTLNLQRAFGAGQPSIAAGEKAQGSADAPPSPPVIAIDAVTLQNGTLDFTDRHMRPAFRTTMVNLGGNVTALVSDAAQPAEIDLRGHLQNQSPLSVLGTIDPLRENLFLKLKIRFSDIELSPATPYSARYLGYAVEKGKLFLDLDYHIEDGALESQNRIFLDQFTFGDRVESEEATSLPVRLAVDLLKDRRGEIRLDLPVRGTLDDPEFSIWGVVLKILKNLLVKAATSPLALLGSMMGGADEFSAVSFAAGTARLSETEREKLSRLAEALRNRPALKLEVMGFADRELDPEGLRQEILQGRMQREKYLELAKRGQTTPGMSAETLELSDTEIPHYLETVYRKAKFPKPRTMIGLVKALPEEEMRKLILTNISAGEEELQSLASDRAGAVRDYLLQEGGIAPERIFQKKVDIFLLPTSTGTNISRVEFSVAKP